MLATESITTPKVSIIVPVYNSEAYLRQCIGSLLSQTLEDIEIICVNDGSTDKSLTIIEEYLKKDSRIKLINQNNKGVAAARNKGRYLSRGEYIAFLNSTDSVKPDTYQKLYESAKEYETDIVICASAILNQKTMHFSEVEPYYTLELFNEEFNNRGFQANETYRFMFDLCTAPWNKLYKRDFLEKKHIIFNEKINYEEQLFFLEAYLSANLISLVKKSLVVHRVKSDEKDSIKLDLFKIMELKKDFLCKKKIYNEIKYYFEKSKRNILVNTYKTIKSPIVKIEYRIKFFMIYPFQKIEKINT